MRGYEQASLSIELEAYILYDGFDVAGKLLSEFTLVRSEPHHALPYSQAFAKLAFYRILSSHSFAVSLLCGAACPVRNNWGTSALDRY